MVTGAISAIVIAAPNLVILGLYLFILPGIILGFMPTVFLYLATFSAAWFGVKKRGELLASFAGVAAIGAVAVGLPTLLNGVTEVRMFIAASRELQLSTPIRHIASAVIEIESDRSRQVPQSCDELCQLLLYNGEARVVVTRALQNKAPMAHQLVTGNCTVSPQMLKELGYRGYTYWTDSAFLERVAKAVRMRRAVEECLTEAVIPATTADLTIRWVDDTLGTKPGPGSLAPGEVTMKGVELRKGNQVLARETVVGASRFTIPLTLEPYGGGSDYKGWRLERKNIPPQTPEIDRLAILKRVTNFDLETPRGLDEGMIRKTLDATLNEPAGSSAAFALVSDYYQMLHKEGLEFGDTDRLVRLIEDARLTDFSYFSETSKKAKFQPKLRDALLARLSRSLDAGDATLTESLAFAASRLPRGAFADPLPEFEAWIADPKVRKQVRIMIPRLAEQGTKGVDKLVSILEDPFNAPTVWTRSDLELIITGLCSSVDSARHALPRLLILNQRLGNLEGVTEDIKWRAMLVALGAAPSGFHPTSKMDQAKYEDDLRRFAKRCALKN